VVVAAVLATVVVAPAWASGIRRQMTEDRDVAMRTAQAWIIDNVDRDAVVLVEDSLWVDLVRAGFDPDSVTWFYKLDLDPAVQVPGGWRGIDYVVLSATPPDIDALPKLQETLAHSETVEAFGQSPDTAIIYEVQK